MLVSLIYLHVMVPMAGIDSSGSILLFVCEISYIIKVIEQGRYLAIVIL